MKRAAGILLLVLVSLWLMPMNVQAAKPEVINIAVIGDFSGPYAPVVGSTRPGTEDAWEHINQTMGGVHGVKVNPMIMDMSGKIDVGLSKYNEAVNTKPKPVFVDIYITPLSEALRTRFVEDGVVGFHAGAVVSLYPQANSYGMYGLYPEFLGLLFKWVKDNWKEKRNPRIGIITWDTSYGRAILIPEFFDYAKKIGVDIAGEPQLYGIREVEVTTQLMKLRAANPDFLATNTTAGGPFVIQKNLKEMGWNIKLLNMGTEEGVVRLGPGLFEGDIVSRGQKTFDDLDDPSVQKALEYFNKNKRTDKDKSYFYFMGWQNALLEHKIMTEIVAKDGWEGLNAGNIVKALNGVKDFEPLGGIAKISYTEKRRTPPWGLIYKIEGGKFVKLADWLELPDMRPAEYR